MLGRMTLELYLHVGKTSANIGVVAVGVNSRTKLQKDKSGVFTGSYARNIATGDAIPVWVVDYVVGSHGTGAIMVVAAHDSRDYEFASKHNLPIRQIVVPKDDSEYTAYTAEVSKLMMSALEKLYSRLYRPYSKMMSAKDRLWGWLFARQRYWGEPFPIIFVEDTGEVVPILESELPVTLLKMQDFNSIRHRQTSTFQIYIMVWRPIGLVADATDNLGRPVGGIYTVRMFLISLKVDIEVGYPSNPTKDESKDPNYFSLACLGTRQEFRCGGVLDDLISLSLYVIT
eukprot:Gb_09366 [translate_table: standard]